MFLQGRVLQGSVIRWQEIVDDADSTGRGPGRRAETAILREDLLLGFWRRLHHARIELVQVGLEAFLGVLRQAGEFDAHADSWIASADCGRGGDALLVDPEIHLKYGGDGQRHRRLNITTVPTDVGGVDAHWSVHALVFKFQGE